MPVRGLYVARLGVRRPGGVRRTGSSSRDPASAPSSQRAADRGGARVTTPRPPVDHQPGPRPGAAARGVRGLPERGGRGGRRGRRRAARAGRELVHLGEPRARRWSRSRSPTPRRPGRPCAVPRTSGVTILADHHDEVCRQLAGPVEHRFDGVAVTGDRRRRGHARRGAGALRLHDLPRGRGRRPHHRAAAAARRRARPDTALPLVFHRSEFGTLTASA